MLSEVLSILFLIIDQSHCSYCASDEEPLMHPSTNWVVESVCLRTIALGILQSIRSTTLLLWHLVLCWAHPKSFFCAWSLYPCWVPLSRSVLVGPALHCHAYISLHFQHSHRSDVSSHSNVFSSDCICGSLTFQARHCFDNAPLLLLFELGSPSATANKEIKEQYAQFSADGFKKWNWSS